MSCFHPWCGVEGRKCIDCSQENIMPTVDRAPDARTANNAAEKAQMVAVKDKGAEFLDLIDTLRTPPEPAGEVDGQPMAIMTFDRELHIARERIEEAVMWAVKHITA
jgi:hypothetical protein